MCYPLLLHLVTRSTCTLKQAGNNARNFEMVLCPIDSYYEVIAIFFQGEMYVYYLHFYFYLIPSLSQGITGLQNSYPLSLHPV